MIGGKRKTQTGKRGSRLKTFDIHNIAGGCFDVGDLDFLLLLLRVETS